MHKTPMNRSEKAQALLNRGWVEMDCVKAEQPGGTLYTIAVKAKKLAARHHVLEYSLEKEGIQRIRIPSHARRIGKFITEPDALLPTNILGTVGSDHFYFENGKAYASQEFQTEIIDGQHRLAGFADEFNESGVDFDLFLTIQVDMSREKKARTFYKINREQKKINPTLAFSLLRVMNAPGLLNELAELVRALNEDASGPFFGKITTNDAPARHAMHNANASITLASLATLLKGFVGTDLGRRVIDSYAGYDALKDLLTDYFGAVAELFGEEWTDADCIIGKTTGIGAFLQLLSDVLIEHRRTSPRRPTREDFRKLLEPLADFDFRAETLTGTSGGGGQRQLARMLREELGLGALFEA